jgi:hypothetical protein
MNYAMAGVVVRVDKLENDKWGRRNPHLFAIIVDGPMNR